MIRIAIAICLILANTSLAHAQVRRISTDTLYDCVKSVRTICITDVAGVTLADAEVRSNTGILIGITDSTGTIKLNSSDMLKHNYLTVNAVGFSTQRIAVDSLKPKVVLQKNLPALLDIVIVSHPRTRLTCYQGSCLRCLGVGKQILKQDSIQKPKNQPMVRVYPNPALRGSVVTIELKSTNAALIECVDNSGVVVWRKSFPEGATPLTLALPIPSSWAAGIYHVRVVRPLQAPQMQRLLIQ